jgi:hypothetical protein
VSNLMLPIGLILGSLVPTFLVSRFVLWLLRRFSLDAPVRAILANTISATVCVLIYAATSLDAEAPLGYFLMQSFFYLFAQLIWLVFDLVKYARTKSKISN